MRTERRWCTTPAGGTPFTRCCLEWACSPQTGEHPPLLSCGHRSIRCQRGGRKRLPCPRRGPCTETGMQNCHSSGSPNHRHIKLAMLQCLGALTKSVSLHGPSQLLACLHASPWKHRHRWVVVHAACDGCGRPGLRMLLLCSSLPPRCTISTSWSAHIPPV